MDRILEDREIRLEQSKDRPASNGKVEDKNRIDPSRRVNIAPMVKKILDTNSQTPEEIMTIIHQAIATENQERQKKGLKALGTESTTVEDQQQDSDEQKIELNVLIASILIPYYQFYSRVLEDIATSHEPITRISPLCESRFVIAKDGSTADELLKAESERLLTSTETYPITHLFIASSPEEYSYRRLMLKREGDTATVAAESTEKIARAEMSARIMTIVYDALLDETFSAWEEKKVKPGNPLASDPALQARYEALAASLHKSSRNRGIRPVSVFNGGFGVGLGIYTDLYNYAHNQITSESTTDQREALAVKLAALIGIPVKIANSHFNHFIAAMGKIESSIKDGSLLKLRPDAKAYTLDSSHQVSNLLVNLNEGDNIMTGCPAIVQGVITKGFEDYIKLRQSL